VSPVAGSPDNISSQLAVAEKAQRPEVLKPLVAPWLKLNDFLDAKIGLRLGVVYATLGQLATEAPSGSSSAGGGILDVFGKMKPGARRGQPRRLGFALRYRHQAAAQRLSTSIRTSVQLRTLRRASEQGTDGVEAGATGGPLLEQGPGPGRPVLSDDFSTHTLEEHPPFLSELSLLRQPGGRLPDSGLGAMFQVTPWDFMR
jgi:hypothetical protein